MSVIKFIRDIARYFKYPSDDQPTTQQDYQNAVKNWVATEESLVDCVLWQPETIYSVENIVKTPSLPSQYYLVCTTAGTSGSTEPDYTSVQLGDNVTDGSVTWKVDSIVSPEIYESFGHGTVNSGNSSQAIGNEVTIPQGTYIVTAFCSITQNNATGFRRTGFWARTVGSSSATIYQVMEAPGNGAIQSLHGANIYGFSSPTIVKSYVSQNSGTSLEMSSRARFLRISSNNLISFND